MTSYDPANSATWSVAVGATAIAALSSSDVVLSLTGSDGRARSFMPTYEYMLGAGLITATTTTYSAVFPAIGSVTEVTDPAGSGQIGQVKVNLTPGSTDPINGSSVLDFVLDANSICVYIAGSTTFLTG